MPIGLMRRIRDKVLHSVGATPRAAEPSASTKAPSGRKPKASGVDRSSSAPPRVRPDSAARDKPAKARFAAEAPDETPRKAVPPRPPRRRKAASDPESSAPSDAPAAASAEAPEGVWTVDRFPVPPQEGQTRFHDFDLPVEIMHAIADLQFSYCTPIQAKSLAHALAGRNVAGRAQTGTGKTAAFLVAILTRFLRDADGRPHKNGTPRALVLAPTRELVVQIASDADLLGRYTGLRTVAVYGGMDYNKQQASLCDRGPVDLIIATPGRLLDFQRSKVIDLGYVDTLVIDEADRMLDMGFIPDVRRIVSYLPPRERRRTQLYSATLSSDVMRLAAQWMPEPIVVEIEPEIVAVDLVHQLVYIVTADEKFTVLRNLALRYPERRMLVFCNRRVGVERVADRLQRAGVPCEMLSGDVQQRKRMQVLEQFRAGEVKIVVATDVAGRGLHVADIGLVVNFELPYEPQDYIHRIGRTGRAGQSGTAVSFACEDESFTIPEIEKLLGEPMKCQHPEPALLERHASDRSATRGGVRGPRRSAPPRRGGPGGGNRGRSSGPRRHVG